MSIRSGPVRFVLEGVFLVVVAIVLAVLALNWLAIASVLAAALLLAVGLDRVSSRREPLRRRRQPEPALAAGPAPVDVLAADEPPKSERAAEAEPVDEAPRPRGLLGRRGRPEQSAADGTAVLPPASEYVDEPREWNVWELDRLARDGGGVDAARDEERALLLMHLRGFAGPDGLLPASFDDLVRESFGELAAVGGG